MNAARATAGSLSDSGLLAALLLGVVAGHVAAAGAAAAARVQQAAGGVELVLDLREPVQTRVFTLREPHRLVIDLHGATVLPRIEPVRAAGALVRGVRTGLHADRARIVLDLDAAPVSFRADTSRTGAGAYRVRVRLAGPGRAAVVQPGAGRALAVSATDQGTPRLQPPSTHADVRGTEEAILPLYMDGTQRGDLHVLIGRHAGSGRAAVDGLIEALDGILSAAGIERIRALADSDGFVGLPELSGAGFDVALDFERVLATVTVAPDLRAVRTLDLRARRRGPPVRADVALAPEPVSAALDMFVGLRHTAGAGRTLSGELDGHVNLHGWVVRNRHAYLGDADRQWQRLQTQLLHDWPDRRLRLSAGDISRPTVGLMGNPPLSGISLATDFALQPYSPALPLSDYEFFLEEDSRLDIYVNGALRESRSLRAGRHRLVDLPLLDGLNDVVLEVTDRLGRRRVLQFFESVERRLLARGLSEFGVTAGVPRQFTRDGLEYDTGAPALSTFLRHGISDTFTGGGYLELDEIVAMAGLLGVWSGRFGTLGVDVAASRDGATGFGARVDYGLRTRGWAVSTDYSWQDSRFATLGQRASARNLRDVWRITLVAPRVAGWTSRASLAARRRWGDGSMVSQRLSFTRGIGSEWRLSLDLENETGSDRDGFGFLARLYWSPASRRLRASASHDSRDDATSVELGYVREGELGLGWRGLAQRRPDADTLRADADYVHPLFEARGEVLRSRGVSSGLADTHAASIGTSLVYAGGHTALSRPLQGQSFAIVTGRPSLGDHRVGILRGLGNRPVAFLDGAGRTAVVPSLSPYYVDRISLDMEELPIDVAVERESFEVMSTLRSGALLEVGLQGRVHILGRLLDARGRPFAYAVGRVVPPGAAAGEGVQFFTDDDGHFEISGLASGAYVMTLQRPAGEARLVVPDGAVGRVQLGTIRAAAAGEQP